MFTPLPDKPDHPALELEILELWEREGTFGKLRDQITQIIGPVLEPNPTKVFRMFPEGLRS